jgi:phospholipase C
VSDGAPAVPTPVASPAATSDRCGYGPSPPLVVFSPFSKTNFVDHTTTDQFSILRFIEDDWQTSHTGNFSFDDKAGNLNDLFTFTDSANGNKQRWQRTVPGPQHRKTSQELTEHDVTARSGLSGSLPLLGHTPSDGAVQREVLSGSPEALL